MDIAVAAVLVYGLPCINLVNKDYGGRNQGIPVKKAYFR